MTITNRRKVDTGADYYPTPTWATEALVDLEEFKNGIVWEPACGNGAMSEVLKRTGCEVRSTDLFDRGYGEERNLNFLNVDDDSYICDYVVTNPPYADDMAEKFAHKGLVYARKKVCLLVRLAFLEGQKRWKTLFNITPPDRVWVFSERITFYPNGKQTGGSGTSAYCWVVWDKSVKKSPETPRTDLLWVPPGYKR